MILYIGPCSCTTIQNTAYLYCALYHNHTGTSSRPQAHTHHKHKTRCMYVCIMPVTLIQDRTPGHAGPEEAN